MAHGFGYLMKWLNRIPSIFSRTRGSGQEVGRLFDTVRQRAVLVLAWIAFLGAVWFGYDWLARPYDLGPAIRATAAAAAAGDWTAADRLQEELEQRWQSARLVAELNHGGTLIAEFARDLAWVRGAIGARDRYQAQAELSSLAEQWKSLADAFPNGM